MDIYNVETHLEVLNRVVLAENPRSELLGAIKRGDVLKTNNWVAAALNSSDENLVEIATEIFNADFEELGFLDY